MIIAIGKSRKDTKWKNVELTWAEFIARIKETTRTHETVEEYRRMPKSKQDDIKDVGGFCGGALKEGRRRKGHVISRELLTLDADYAPVDLFENIKLLFDFTAAVYSTHKHTPESPRLRLIIPLNRPVTADEYKAIARRVAADIGIDYFDDSTYEPERLMYWPSTSKDGIYYFDHIERKPLDADKELARYIDWKDASLWPVSSRIHTAITSNSEKQGDPATKPGLVGVFCRTYTISEVIDKYLNTIYEPCGANRYTYTKGSTYGGLVVYDDQFAYSHHGSDPASGRLCNSFDLVRIHLFGDKDVESDSETPVNRLPSFKLMNELVLKDENARETMGKDKLQSTRSDFAAEEIDTEWLKKLDYNKQGKLEQTPRNVMLVLENDPGLAGTVGKDVFRQRAVLIKDLPWRKRDDDIFWNNDDDATLRNFLHDNYGLHVDKIITNAFAEVVNRHSFHPVRDYLNSLKWDGVKRLDTLLIDYLGADDDEYTRAVTRKTFTAAVKRVFKPGCKFDYMLTLVGPQGIGKSRIAALMGKDWFSDTLSTVQGKEAYEQLQGFWIIEMGELSAMRKAEAESFKYFVSKQEDSYRPAYGRQIETYKRQCIIIGTTNEDEFLKDHTGNRRFWTVKVKERNFGKLTEDIVDQMWAEAVEAYKNGEKLYLEGKLEKMAEERQKQHMQSSVKQGMIEDYLDRLLPENWDDMDLFARRMFLQDTSQKGTVQRIKVCVLEVYAELFNGDVKNCDERTKKEIRNIIRGLPDWEEATLRFKYYGRQRGFKRINYEG